jgi:hypothetical protein
VLFAKLIGAPASEGSPISTIGPAPDGWQRCGCGQLAIRFFAADHGQVHPDLH